MLGGESDEGEGKGIEQSMAQSRGKQSRGGGSDIAEPEGCAGREGRAAGRRQDGSDAEGLRQGRVAERARLLLLFFLRHQNQQREKVSSGRREGKDWRPSLVLIGSHGQPLL